MGIDELITELTSRKESELLELIDLRVLHKVVSEELGVYAGAGVRRNIGQFSLVWDVEARSVHRLYGGFSADWLCGGQWLRMEQYIRELILGAQAASVHFFPILNACFDEDQLEKWHMEQKTKRENISQLFRFIQAPKNQSPYKPPPKVWWVKPTCLESCARLILRYCQVQFAQSISCHSIDVMRYAREQHYHGILSDSPVYWIVQPERLFLASSFKLYYNGKLEASQARLVKLAQILKLSKDRLPLFASLMGNHLLTETDLMETHEMIRQLHQDENMDDDDVGQLARCVIDVVSKLSSANAVQELADMLFNNLTQEKSEILRSKLQRSVQYYQQLGRQPRRSKLSDLKSSLNPVPESSGECQQQQSDVSSESSTHSTPPDQLSPVGSKTSIPSNILRAAVEQHRSGGMHPWIYQILHERRLRIELGFEDVPEADSTLPLSSDMFRVIRQRAFYLLLGDAREPVTEYLSTSSRGLHSELVYPVRCTTAACQDLWFGGNQAESATKRMSSLLCVLGETRAPLLLNTQVVPPFLLWPLLSLRYLLLNEPAVLLPPELDCFLATFVSNYLHGDPEVIKKVDIEFVTPRGAQLASLFMMSMEHVLLANDVCGRPIPCSLLLPWKVFDGRLFQWKLALSWKTNSLMEVCEKSMDCYQKVERLRRALFEGITPHFKRPPGAPPPTMLSPVSQPPPPIGTATSMALNMRGRGRGIVSHVASTASSGHPPLPPPQQPVPYPGGQLSIGGVVVANWGPNQIKNPPRFAPGPDLYGTRGRGGRNRGARAGRHPEFKPIGSSRSSSGRVVPIEELGGSDELVGVRKSFGRGLTVGP